MSTAQDSQLVLEQQSSQPKVMFDRLAAALAREPELEFAVLVEKRQSL